MSYQIRYSDKAILDIQVAFNWYEEKQINLGERFLSQLEPQIEYLSKYPLHFPSKYKQTREMVMRGFPFVVLYILEENQLFIQAVFAAKQNPSKKYR